jgi:hypothetical protein
MMATQNNISSYDLLNPDRLALIIHRFLGTATGTITTNHSPAYSEKIHDDDTPKGHQHSIPKLTLVDSKLISHTIAEIERIFLTSVEDALNITEEVVVYALGYIARIGKRQLSCGLRVLFMS